MFVKTYMKVTDRTDIITASGIFRLGFRSSPVEYVALFQPLYCERK